MATSPDFIPDVVVMAKPAVAGAVKTRLIGALSAEQAAQVHAAMLQCTLQRVARHVPGRHVLAMAGDSADAADPIVIPDAGDRPWRTVGQGTGDLGQRLDHVWRSLGGGAVVFLGVDAPDVPAAALRAIVPALHQADVAVGPASDGGYWTLAARRYAPALLRGIDWGGATVYHSTMAAAAAAGLVASSLPVWHDVDQPDDLAALRRRLASTPNPVEPALADLADRLRLVCENPP